MLYVFGERVETYKPEQLQLFIIWLKMKMQCKKELENQKNATIKENENIFARQQRVMMY